MRWSSVLNLKLRAERFEQRMKVKMIIEHIIKALLKSKMIYSFELIYSHGLVPGITHSICFCWRNPQAFFGWTSQIFGFKKMLLVFIREYVLVIYQYLIEILERCKKTIIQVKLESSELPRSVFSRLEISTDLMEFFVISFKRNLFFELPW